MSFNLVYWIYGTKFNNKCDCGNKFTFALLENTSDVIRSCENCLKTYINDELIEPDFNSNLVLFKKRDR